MPSFTVREKEGNLQKAIRGAYVIIPTKPRSKRKWKKMKSIIILKRTEKNYKVKLLNPEALSQKIWSLKYSRDYSFLFSEPVVRVSPAPPIPLLKDVSATAQGSRTKWFKTSAPEITTGNKGTVKSCAATIRGDEGLFMFEQQATATQPYKVLCDGTFVHHLIENRIIPADNALSNALAAPVKLFTTKCVIDELKRLGQSHSEAVEAAYKVAIARCEHEKLKSADACLMEVIGEKNPEHFFVATQDVDLRKKLQEVPGVPLIFGLRNALLLEPPSSFQRKFVKTSEEARSCMTKSEFKKLKKSTKNILETKEIGDSSNKNEELENQKLEMQADKKTHYARKGMGVKDRPQFKRKRAKAPNPLSCKKKKNHENPSTSSGKPFSYLIESLKPIGFSSSSVLLAMVTAYV
ncbi:PIN domain-like family protein [Citrus sinensis]|uniref:PIN domain-like family protein n=1 Tax=Citrus sinensis TaxID=2711 RepID=A0ACB8N0E1_CITSI|nr:PIN domain-like family protein [Citrus sinensis]